MLRDVTTMYRRMHPTHTVVELVVVTNWVLNYFNAE